MEFRDATGVSRETMDRLHQFVELLGSWNSRHNLVSSASFGSVWRRHLWDSAQLWDHVPPEASTLVDLGSGAGFPGLILALLALDRPRFQVVLYEATRKKSDFLSLAAAQLGLAIDVRNARVEHAAAEAFDIVTARACAPLPRLLLYAQPFQAAATVNLFLKGQSVDDELTEAGKSWNMRVKKLASRSDPTGTILLIEDLRPSSARRR